MLWFNHICIVLYFLNGSNSQLVPVCACQFNPVKLEVHMSVQSEAIEMNSQVSSVVLFQVQWSVYCIFVCLND